MRSEESMVREGVAAASEAEKPQNRAQAVSVGDLFMLPKLAVAAVPFVIALAVALPFLVSASPAFFAGATRCH